MRVVVAGLWHLGTVTAACLASAGHEVVGIDFDAAVVSALNDAKPPVREPGLAELVIAGLANGRLSFSTEAHDTAAAEVVWITYDTPVNADDQSDSGFVIEQVTRLFPHLSDGALVLISSQVPVGTTRTLAERFARVAAGRHVGFAYSPENLRLGKAIDVFTNPDRVIIGVGSMADREKATTLLTPVTARLEWMSVESAEMTKHAINAFLATSVTFINEVAAICEQVGADAREVERGLKTEARIGPKAYLSPGGAFAGGTLARDVVTLAELGRDHDVPTHLLSSIKTSNDAHRQWAQTRLDQLLDGVTGRTIAVWGLTYKPGTDTLRRSSAIELCEWLVNRGATVRAHDPAIHTLPPELAARVSLAESALASVTGADALVISTPWPDYRRIDAADVTSSMKGRLVLDANRFTGETLGKTAGLQYISVGVPAA